MIEKRLKSYDGIEIAYFVELSGSKKAKQKKTLVFLHGVCGNHTLMNNQIEHLKRRYNIIALDLRGHGKSERLRFKSQASLENFAYDIKAVLDREKVKKAILVGLSIGGIISLKCYELFSTRISGLIIISSSYNFFETTSRTLKIVPAIIKRSGIKEEELLKKKFIPKKSGYYPDFSKLDTQNLKKEYAKVGLMTIDRPTLQSFIIIGKELLKWDMKHIIKRIRIPCLFLTGKDDKLVTPQAAYEMAAKIPSGIAEIIDGTDHDMILKKPAETNRIIDEFLCRFIEKKGN